MLRLGELVDDAGAQQARKQEGAAQRGKSWEQNPFNAEGIFQAIVLPELRAQKDPRALSIGTTRCGNWPIARRNPSRPLRSISSIRSHGRNSNGIERSKWKTSGCESRDRRNVFHRKSKPGASQCGSLDERAKDPDPTACAGNCAGKPFTASGVTTTAVGSNPSCNACRKPSLSRRLARRSRLTCHGTWSCTTIR